MFFLWLIRTVARNAYLKDVHFLKSIVLVLLIYLTYVFCETLQALFGFPSMIQANGVLAVVVFGLCLSSHDGNQTILLGGGEQLVQTLETSVR